MCNLRMRTQLTRPKMPNVQGKKKSLQNKAVSNLIKNEIKKNTVKKSVIDNKPSYAHVVVNDIELLNKRVKIIEQAKPQGKYDEKRLTEIQEEINTKTVNKSEFMEALKAMQTLASKSEEVKKTSENLLATAKAYLDKADLHMHAIAQEKCSKLKTEIDIDLRAQRDEYLELNSSAAKRLDKIEKMLLFQSGTHNMSQSGHIPSLFINHTSGLHHQQNHIGMPINSVQYAQLPGSYYAGQNFSQANGNSNTVPAYAQSENRYPTYPS